MDRMNYSFSLSVTSGGLPSVLTANNHFDIEASDKISVAIPISEMTSAPIELLGVASGYEDVPIPTYLLVQPGTPVQAIMITASDYTVPMTMVVNESQTIVLDAPLNLVGGGVALLGEIAPQLFSFTNVSSAPITLNMLIGRTTIISGQPG